MSNLKRYLKRFILFCIVVLFIILSYFKFYTIQVSFSNDPTVAIVKTKDIQWIANTYRIDKEGVPYNWYDDYGFKMLHADEMGHKWQTIHSFMIIVWWIIFIYLGFNTIKLITKKLKNTSLDKPS